MPVDDELEGGVDTGEGLSDLATLFEDSPEETESSDDAAPEAPAKPKASVQSLQSETPAETGIEDAEVPSATEEELPDSDTGQVPVAAVVKERKRRQEETQLKLQAQEQARRLQEQIDAQSAPDPVDDPEAFEEWQRNRVDNREWETSWRISSKYARTRHDDFDSVERAFIGRVADETGKVTDQATYDAVRKADDPAEEMYQRMKALDEIEKFSDPKKREAYEAELRAKIVAEVTANLSAAPSDEPVSSARRAAAVPGLATVTGTGGPSTPEEREIANPADLFPDEF